MNYPAASYGVSKTVRNEASFGEYDDPKRFKQKSILATAVSSYDRFSKIKTRILALSHENTNIKSLTIFLNQRRKVMLLCQDTLNKLQQAILEEPIAGVIYGRPARSR